MAQQMMGVIGQDNGFMRELDRIKSEDSESDSFVTILHEDSSGNSGSADLHEDNTDASGFSGHESEHKFHGMDPPHSRQRRSAPSPEIPGDVMQIESGNKSSKISSPQAGDRTYHENSEPSAHDDKGIDSKLAAFKERAGEPTSLRAYNSYYENPHYVDLEDPQLSDAYAKRLQAMHDKNAEESRHHRIPPKDAPPHMQVMVVLYQWAAWALEISNDKLRGRLIKWVNGRFLDFMMSGGRIPGYNLKELLEIAGVDARELYGYQRVTNMSSNQLPATISGEQETQLQPGLENVEANMEPGFNQVDHASSAAKDASYEEDDGAIVFTDNDDDDEEDDMGKSGRNPAKHASTNGNTFRNRDGPPLPVEEAMLHEGSGAIANNRKREAVSDEDMDQKIKRQKTQTEDLTGDLPISHDPSAHNTIDPISSYLKSEQYRQTFFKAKVNALLKAKQRSQIRKELPEWPKLEARLQMSGLPDNVINTLKGEYHEGWKTWDGSAFAGLPEDLAIKTATGISQKPAYTSSPATLHVQPPPSIKIKNSSSSPQATSKIKIKHQKPHINPKPKSKTKAPEEEYDSADVECTAAKSSVKTRRQYDTEVKSGAGKKGRGRRGRGVKQ